jgi:hypothetical protein
VTAPDPRLDEIQARLDAANAELDRLTEGNPGANWRWSIPANPERDSDLILSASIADIAYLLAELRKAREALARVEAVADDLATQSDGLGLDYSDDDFDRGWHGANRAAVDQLRAAVAAAKGDGEHVPGSSAAECPCQECRDCCATFAPPKGDERG